MKAWNISISILFALLSTSATYSLNAQAPSYPYFYRVYLKDKGNNLTGRYNPSDLLSARALNRRQKFGIQTDFRDYPVEKKYLDQIALLGLKLHSTSKWMNTALFKSQTAIDLEQLTDLPFVSDVKIVKTPGNKSLYNNKLDFQITQTNFPSYDRPLTQVNGVPLHNSGFDGKGILIAILDGGFIDADNISSLNNLRSRKGIKATYDFVKTKSTVYDFSSHGTAVLSVLAGNIPGLIEGTAPGADYMLLKTEDVDSEFPCEEDFWAAGAEFADSSGADIISSSLGYFTFDDPSLNYKISDLNGNTAFVTRVADIAASKGILVVNSAGNERTQTWKYIIFPADGDSVMTAGGVDGNNLIADFSSAGPTFDRRIKPDNVTMGVDVPVQVSTSSVGRASGTSFSCPILSGMAACLEQAVPGAINIEIINALHRNADRYNFPDSLYGYGIPDMVKTLLDLQNIYVKVPDNDVITSPNPTSGNFEIIFSAPPENVSIELISLEGKLILRKNLTNYAGRTILITELQHRESGIYFLRLINGSKVSVRKVIKVKSL